MPSEREAELEALLMEKWQFDRRISMGHIVSMVTSVFITAGMVLGVYMSLNNRTLMNEQRIGTLEKATEKQDQQISKQLEQINNKLDAHIGLHIQGRK